MIQSTRKKSLSKLPVPPNKLIVQRIEAVGQLMEYEIHAIHVDSAITAYRECLEHLEDPLYDDTHSSYTIFWRIRSQTVAERRDSYIKKVRSRLFQLEMELEDVRFRIESVKARIRTLKSYLDIADEEAKAKAEARLVVQTPVPVRTSRSVTNHGSPVEIDLTATHPGPITGLPRHL